MAKPSKTGLARIIDAAGYSVQGLKALWCFEAAFRQELVLFLVALPLALYFGETGLERALLIFVVGLAVVVETINSAIEAVVDRVGDEYHELSGRAKDMGSAAVFLVLGLAGLVWILVLWP